MNIFIGNLSFNVTEGDLRQAFEAFGQVASATVIKDKQSGRSKGAAKIKEERKIDVAGEIDAAEGATNKAIRLY
jgi:hypothetical protein